MDLDTLDRKILAQLDLDSRQSAQEIAKKIKSNKDTVNYRMKRLVDEGIITKWLARVETAKFGFNNIKVYIRFQDIDEKKEKEFFDFLNALPEVGWVVQASGRWDALFCVWASSTFSFYKTMSKIMNRFSKNIFEKEVVHNIVWFYYNRKWLLPESGKIHAIQYGGEPCHEKLDKVDMAILGELTADSRKRFTDIAEKIKISPQNVLNRVKSLRAKGVITLYGIDINYGLLGLIFTKAFIALDNADEESLAALYRFCERELKVFALTATVGAWDLELEFEVSRVEEMMDIMNRIKRAFPNMIKGYDSIVITKQLKINYMPTV
jgi:DNA-binding Lrp family transcriptional regulator